MPTITNNGVRYNTGVMDKVLAATKDRTGRDISEAQLVAVARTVDNGDHYLNKTELQRAAELATAPTTSPRTTTEELLALSKSKFAARAKEEAMQPGTLGIAQIRSINFKTPSGDRRLSKEVHARDAIADKVAQGFASGLREKGWKVTVHGASLKANDVLSGKMPNKYNDVSQTLGARFGEVYNMLDIKAPGMKKFTLALCRSRIWTSVYTQDKTNFFAAFVDPKTRQTFGSGYGVQANPLTGARHGDTNEIDKAVSNLLDRMDEFRALNT